MKRFSLLPFLALLLLLPACGGAASAAFSAEERASLEANGRRIAELRLANVP